MRRAVAVDELVGPNVVVTSVKDDSGDEVWQLKRGADMDQVVDECNILFEDLNDRCTRERRRARKRAAALALAALTAGLVFGGLVA